MKYDRQTDRHKQLCCFTHFSAGKVTFPGRFEMKYDKQTDISGFAVLHIFPPGKVTFPGKSEMKYDNYIFFTDGQRQSAVI